MDITPETYIYVHLCSSVYCTGIRTPEAGHAVTPLFVAGGETHRVTVRRRTMPVDLSEAQTGGVDLLFADNVSGTVFELREASVYQAEEVREEIDGDIPKFGKWMPVTTANGDAWIVALGELVDELKTYDNPMGVTFDVTRCEKSGSQQTDPYEVNLEVVDGDLQQTGL